MNYTGTFNFEDCEAYKGLRYHPTSAPALRRSGKKANTPRSLIITTYAIDDRESGKGYVGSTEDFFGRWQKHLLDLRGHRHSNQNLQNAFNVRGAIAFTIRILNSYQTTDDLIEHEIEDGLMNYSIEDLYNNRLGNTYTGLPNWQTGDGTRTKKLKPLEHRVKQMKPRWFDRQKTRGASV